MVLPLYCPVFTQGLPGTVVGHQIAMLSRYFTGSLYYWCRKFIRLPDTIFKIYIYIYNLFIIVPFLSCDPFPHILSQRQHASASKGENGSLCSQMRGWVSARAHWSIKSHLQAVQLALVILTSTTLAKERKHTSELTDRNSMWMKHAQDSSSYSLEELQLSRCLWTFWFGRWCGACLCWRGYICSLQ